MRVQQPNKRELVVAWCPTCKQHVKAAVEGRYVAIPQEVDPTQFTLLSCGVCKWAIVTEQDLQIQMNSDGEVDEGFGKPRRLWPQPEPAFWQYPAIVRDSLEEAQRCLDAGANRACVVMCGRALEALCNELGETKQMLAGGLKELLTKGVIDQRLFEWGTELRRLRNVGAHATSDHVGGDDARDMTDFAVAICDYVLVLKARFDSFKARQAKRGARKR
jgi:hypothetical protein